MRYLVKNLVCGFALLVSSTLLLTSCVTPRAIKSDSAVPHSTTSTYETVHTRPTPRQGQYHSVAPGETLWRIAKMYDADIDALKDVNRIQNVRDLKVGRKLYVPNAAPRKHIVSLYPNKKWKNIVIHHSATGVGNSMQFNKAHKKKGWKGVGYHFIIDNGTCGKDDGQIETTPRWINQEDGAHCKAGEMNKTGIGICLVGNFSKERVSRKQLNSLVYLVKTLQGFYHIPDNRVFGHGNVPGAQTECPGKKFPWKKFRRRI